MKQALILLTLLLVVPFSYGQRLKTPTLSPYSEASQEVGLTTVSISYARPAAKGRVVFGELVPYNKVWRTGANASSKITFLEDAFIADKPVPAGTYAIYTIPGKDQWTVIIHSNTKLRSLAGGGYKQENDLFRFKTTPITTAHYTENFTLQFADVQSNTVNLQLSWENTLVNIPIRVLVDAKIEAQLGQMPPETIPHRTYFEAAQYYLNNGKSLTEAMDYINTAIEKSPENYRYGLLKAKIHDKAGDQAAALESVNLANTWAKAANNANYIEQTAIYKAYLLAKD